jgi:hypothetical protein
MSVEVDEKIRIEERKNTQSLHDRAMACQRNGCNTHDKTTIISDWSSSYKYRTW